MPYGKVGKENIKDGIKERNLAQCDKFTSKTVSLSGKYVIDKKETFVSLIVIEGELTVKWTDGEIASKKGDSIFIPAGLNVELNGQAELLYSCV